MRALIIGASGQVGGLLLQRCRQEGWECLGTAFKHGGEGLATLDIREARAVDACVRGFGPDVVFLPGALTFVDYCETHPDECYAINVEGTANVARAVAAAELRLDPPFNTRGKTPVLVFFSTEHVFSDSPDAYSEDAPTAPKSVYAKSKVAAEEHLRAILPDAHLILRTSWVFGPETQRKNFVYRAVGTLRRGERLAVPQDQYGQPTYSVDLAAAALAALQKGLRGTFHAVGPAHVTRLEFARLIARVFGLDETLIAGVDTAALQQPAPRPRHIRLSREKLAAALGADPIRQPESALTDMRDGPPSFRP